MRQRWILARAFGYNTSVPRMEKPLVQRLSQLRLAGHEIHIRWFSPPPPELPRTATLIRRRRFPARNLACAYWRGGGAGRYRIFWSNAGTFDLDARSSRVRCYLLPRSSPTTTEEVLRGPVCSFFLLERGFEPLHASAVMLRRRCVAFVGRAGAGKSSLVAYLSQYGAGFLADDLLPLRTRRDSVRAYPGLAQIRLVPRAVRALGWDARPVWSTRWKATVPVRPVLAGTSVPLARFYFLERRAGRNVAPHIVPLAPREAFLALVSNTMNAAEDAPWRMHNQLRTFGWLASHVGMRRLIYPDGFGELPAVRQTILRDLER